MVLASSKPDLLFEDNDDGKANLTSMISQKKHVLAGLEKGFAPRALKLFVALFALLSVSDLDKLGDIVWEHFLENTDSSVLTSVRVIIYVCDISLTSGLLGILSRHAMR